MIVATRISCCCCCCCSCFIYLILYYAHSRTHTTDIGISESQNLRVFEFRTSYRTRTACLLAAGGNNNASCSWFALFARRWCWKCDSTGDGKGRLLRRSSSSHNDWPRATERSSPKRRTFITFSPPPPTNCDAGSDVGSFDARMLPAWTILLTRSSALFGSWLAWRAKLLLLLFNRRHRFTRHYCHTLRPKGDSPL